LGLACARTLPGFLDHSQGCAGRGVIAFERAFCELEEKGLGRGDMALGSALADFDHLAENGLIGRFAMTPPRTTGRIAALALCCADVDRPINLIQINLVTSAWTALALYGPGALRNFSRAALYSSSRGSLSKSGL
jgi:hypothetical protein